MVDLGCTWVSASGNMEAREGIEESRADHAVLVRPDRGTVPVCCGVRSEDHSEG